MQLLSENAVLVALIWMLLANLAALGPDRFKVGALVVMLISAGVIIPALIRNAGWLIGLPIVTLMGIQMRWAVVFIRRLIADVFAGKND